MLNMQETPLMQHTQPAGSSSSSSRSAGKQLPRLRPMLLIHTAALTAMTVFTVWVLANYRLVPYTQLQQQEAHLQNSPCRKRFIGQPVVLYPSQGSSHTTSSSSSSSSDDGALSGSSSSSQGEHAVASSSRYASTSDPRSNPSLPKWMKNRKKTGSWAEHLLTRLEAQQQRAQDPDYQAKLREAAARPISIMVMSGVFWNIQPRVEGCSLDGVPLECRWSTNKTRRNVLTADALHYHAPTWASLPRRKAFPTQLRIAASLESATYYPQLDDPGYMCHYDAEFTYRHCSQAISWYSLEAMDLIFHDPLVPLVPFEDKLHAIAYINTNCGAESGRSDILRALMALGHTAKVPVHSYGNCDKNMAWPDGEPSKHQVFSEYKFCVTMENSLAQDYVSEKIWDGLHAGCIPVYLGSNSVRDMVPDPHSFIMFDPSGGGDASTPQELDALMHEIGSSKQRYEAMLAWKHRKPEEQPNPLFRHLWAVHKTPGECALCQFIARHRVDPQEQYDTCLFNKEWMAAADQPLVPQELACPGRAARQARLQHKRQQLDSNAGPVDESGRLLGSMSAPESLGPLGNV